MEENRILEKETVCEGKFLRFLRVAYRDSKGIVRDWETVERVDCDGAVVIVPITDEGEVVLVRQFRPPVNRNVVALPAGLKEKDEKPEDTAARELLEETGYDAKELVFLTEGPASSGAFSEVLTIYVARGLEFKGSGGMDVTEEIEAFKVPVDRLYEEIHSFTEKGDFVDLKILGLVELARRQGFI